jgi:hypothetical protein
MSWAPILRLRAAQNEANGKRVKSQAMCGLGGAWVHQTDEFAAVVATH